MLNLVQLQERLKGIPMQALMQYANGANPQVPPFLALGELNRRKKMQEGAAAEQAQATEGAPTIKEQIEQSAGLLALQGNRQRQAAQQQAQAQQAMPMAAPNTTTSEPAQLAGGGFVEDIVVPRDYQLGGQVKPQMNPEMLKRLMMLKAMKQKPGLSGLQTRPDMFKRSDYAGGGIVAFAAGSKDPIGKAPYEDEEEQRKSDAEAMLNTLKKLKAAGMDIATLPGRAIAGAAETAITRPLRAMGLNIPYLPKEFYGGNAASMTPYFDQLTTNRASLANLPQADYSNEGRAYERGRAETLDPRKDRLITKEIPEVSSSPGSLAEKPTQGLASLPFLRKLQNVNLDEMFPTPEAFSEQAQFEKQKARKERYGVSDQYLTDAERRLEERMGKQAARRAEQPMDQLISFLGGVAGGRRGGTFGTQGAEGAAAAQKLRMAQQEANERQDEANDQLRMAIAEKRQALARGDMDAAAAAERDIKNAILESKKAKIDFLKAGAQAEAQGMTAQASLEHARRPSAGMEAFNLWQKSPTAYEAFKRAGGMSDENFMLRVQNAAEKILEKDMEYRTLQLSPKPEDKQKAAQIRQNALNQAMRDLQMISSGISGGISGGPTGGQRIRLDAQGNVISQ